MARIAALVGIALAGLLLASSPAAAQDRPATEEEYLARLAQARTYFEKALALRPGDPTIIYFIGRTYDAELQYRLRKYEGIVQRTGAESDEAKREQAEIERLMERVEGYLLLQKALQDPATKRALRERWTMPIRPETLPELYESELLRMLRVLPPSTPVTPHPEFVPPPRGVKERPAQVDHPGQWPIFRVPHPEGYDLPRPTDT